MASWLTYILVLAFGVGVGMLFASRRSQPNTGLATVKESGKSLKRLYKDCPKFFDNIREELGRPGFEDVREFAILESSSVTYVSDKLKFYLLRRRDSESQGNCYGSRAGRIRG